MSFKRSQLITMGSLVGVGLFNPFSVAVLADWFQLVYMGIFIACVAWVVVYVLVKAFKPETNNIPKKAVKNSKAGMKYETI